MTRKRASSRLAQSSGKAAAKTPQKTRERSHPPAPTPTDDLGCADVLSSMLGTLRLTAARYCAADVPAPWGISWQARQNPVFHVVDRGTATLTLAPYKKARSSRPHKLPPVALSAGDVVLLPFGHEHTLSDLPGRTPKVVDFPQRPQIRQCEGPLRWPGAGARTLIVCGEFHVEGPTIHTLLGELPPLIVLRAGESSEWLSMTLRLLAHEALGMAPGSQVVIERLIEVIFVHCLRDWLGSGKERTRKQPRGWLYALRDAAVAQALTLLHRQPAHPWTVEELGRQIGLSRSVFAERFSEAVGEPPLSYLTRWRMQLAAAQLLTLPRPSLKTIAEAVGYRSEAAFNRAFRKLTGMPPARWRSEQPTAS